jgi:hypothetical protein
VFHHRLFAVRASIQLVPVPMVSEPTAPEETLKAPALAAFASALADLLQADLEPLQSAEHEAEPARLYRPAFSPGDTVGKYQSTS